MTPPNDGSVVTLTPTLVQTGLFMMATVVVFGGLARIRAMISGMVFPVGKQPLTMISAAFLAVGIDALTRWMIVLPPRVVLGITAGIIASVSTWARASSR